MERAGRQARGLPLRKLSFSALAAAAFGWFYFAGPLQERPAPFEFKPEMVGFAEPVRFGEEQRTAATGVVGELESHLDHGLVRARSPARPTYGLVGDTRSSPGLRPETGELILARARERAAFPPGVSLRRALDMFFVEGRDVAGRPLELHFENTGLNRGIKGYAGPIDIALVVGMDGRIRAVQHVASMETTSYLQRIESAGFYQRFVGLPLDAAAHRVDFVSGASLSTEGIARSVSQLVSLARESPLPSYLAGDVRGFSVRAEPPRTWMLEAALIALLFALVAVRRLRRSPRVLLAIGVTSVAFLGFWMNNSFTWVTFTQPFLGVRWSWLLGIYAALVVVAAIWDGNAYCRYVCPYGNVQRLLLRFLPWRGRLPVSNRVLGGLRWAITLCLLGGIVMGLRDWGSYEPFPDLFGLEFASSPWFWLALGLVLVSVYYPMLWCRALCPTGAVLDGIASLARARHGSAPVPARASHAASIARSPS